MRITKKLIKSKVIKYADLLGIGDYKYHVNLISKNKLLKDNCALYASILVDDECREVYLQINKDLLKERPEELDVTIIHELLHVRFSEITSLFSLLCKHYVKDEKAKKMYINQVNLHEHKIIVALANIMNKDKNNG